MTLNRGSIRSKEKVEHIYKTAMQMFKHRGYGNTTIRDICKAAQISPSTFYHFFGDKFGVLMRFYGQVMGRRSDYLKPSTENLAHPYQSVLNYLVFATAVQDLMGKEFSRETMLSKPEVLFGHHDAVSQYNSIHHIARFLQAAIDAGTLSPATRPWFVAEYLLSGAGGVIMNWITLSEEESAIAIAKRLLPKLFSAVTEEALTVEAPDFSALHGV